MKAEMVKKALESSGAGIVEVVTKEKKFWQKPYDLEQVDWLISCKTGVEHLLFVYSFTNEKGEVFDTADRFTIEQITSIKITKVYR